MEYFGKASTSRETTEEKQAEEKLKLVLIELGMDKQTDTAYNENDYIDSRINSQEEMTVLENDIVSVEGWKFEIDRSVPKIGKSLGKEELNTAIQIETNATISSDYTKSTITIEIFYEGEIASITINGEEKEAPEKQDGKYVLSTEVVDNGDYEIIVKDKEGKYNRKIVKVNEIIADMYIYNKADMEKFRDIVNIGKRTFKDNHVYVMDEIYLEGSSSNQWTPINNFEGTFEGNNHTIHGIYIDSSENQIGLFKQNGGTIQNVITSEDSYIKGNNSVGGVVGRNNGTIEHVVNKAKVESTSYMVGGIAGFNYGEISQSANLGEVLGGSNETSSFTGGICGRMKNGRIEKCYNKGTLTIKSSNTIGGIIGLAQGGIIENCYNSGIIIAFGPGGSGILSYTGGASEPTVYVTNCYNIGKLQGETHLRGGIVGNDENAHMKATNNYWLDTCGASVGIGRPSGNTNAVKKTAAEIKNLASTLGAAYTNDIQNEDGTWKYNDGYPILKWQLEN